MKIDFYNSMSEAYLEPCASPKITKIHSTKIVNGSLLLTIFTKYSTLDVWQGSEYMSACRSNWSATPKYSFTAYNCMFKVNNRNARTRCQICFKLTIKKKERHKWRCSGVFIVNSEHISHLVLMFLLLTLSR